MGEQLRRCNVVRIYEVRDRMVVLGRDGRGHELAGDSAALAREVLTFVEHPRTLAEIVAHLEALTGAPMPEGSALDDLLALLIGTGSVERVAAPSDRMVPHVPGPRVVLGVTGAVATMHAPGLVQRLLERRHQVRVVATGEALRFVRPEALEALTHHRVVDELWPSGDASHVPHIDLAQWADAVLVCPASATTIGRIASGDHSSIVSATALATRAPVVVVPSMNPAMLASPAVQRNLATLVGDGVYVVHPAGGLEVADAPHERTPMIGAAPPWSTVVMLLEAVLHGARRAPHDASDWDALYRRPDAELPWHADAPDQDILAELRALAPSSVLEVGTGLGTIAIACARMAHRVIATDISASALERCPKTDGVVWLQDDITATRLHARFDVAIDRGCLHLLGPSDARRWVAAMARLVVPGGAIVLKTFDDAGAAGRAANGYDAARLATLLGDAFTIAAERASTMPGPDGAPSARLFVLRRTVPASP
jgi:SAM-dependent methyltransferase/3-polyprenyl-4-hydroxybenzoate decarboxylase